MRIRSIVSLRTVNARTICNILLYIFLFDSAFHILRDVTGGSNIGRIIILGCMLVLSFIPVLIGRKIKLDLYKIMFIFLCVSVVCGYIKSIINNGNMNYANTYIINGYVYILFLPILYYSIQTIEDVNRLIIVAILIGTLTSLCSLMILITSFTLPIISTHIISVLERYQVVVMISQMGRIIRICLSGMIVQILALFGGLYFFVKNKEKKYLAVIAVNAMGILLTYARGLIGGTVMAVLAWMIMSTKNSGSEKESSKLIIMFSAFGIIMLLVYMVIGTHGDIVGYVFDRFFGNSKDTVLSDDFRKSMNIQINNKILEFPVFGAGLGAHINLRDGAIEMTYHDIIIRTGFIGLFLFFLPYTYMIFHLNTFSFYNLKISIFCALTAIMLASYTNPYLITSFGFFIYCLCTRIFTLNHNEQR